MIKFFLFMSDQLPNDKSWFALLTIENEISLQNNIREFAYFFLYIPIYLWIIRIDTHLVQSGTRDAA